MAWFDFWEDAWKKLEKYDPIGHGVSKALIKNDSKNAEKIGNAIGWDYLEEEGKRNYKDPARGAARGGTAAAMWWLPAAYGAAGNAIGNSGMFATQGAQQAAQQAALQSGMSTSGLFSQVPGVSAGSEQAAMLAAQNAGFGGAGADMTAQAAMSAVKDAYASGQMGTMDYLTQIAKRDLAGMDDPSVWGSRLSKNMDRMAGNMGRRMATNAASNAMQPQQPMQPQRPMPQQQQPEQVSAAEAERLKAAYLSGQITLEEFLRRVKGSLT